MPMNLSAPAIPTIGTAKLVATVAIVTLECTCKTIIMGQIGLPLVCTSCKKAWFVTATTKMQIQEILVDMSKELLANRA